MRNQDLPGTRCLTPRIEGMATVVQDLRLDRTHASASRMAGGESRRQGIDKKEAL
jgi:hypothetical protein